MTKIYCDKTECKYNPQKNKDGFKKEGYCLEKEIQIEDQGNCFSCNSCEVDY